MPGGSVVKSPPVSAGDARDSSSIPGWEDPLEKAVATHSSILAWGVPWTEEPGGLQSMGLPKGKKLDMTSQQHKVSGQNGEVLGPELRFF